MSPRPPQPPADEGRQEGLPRDERLGAALSGLPVPDHGPTFWADLSTRIEGEVPVPTTESRELHQPPPSATGPAPSTESTPISLDRQRSRRAARRGRTTRSLAAAAAVALVVAAAGAVAVIRQDSTDRQVTTADRPGGTGQPGPAPTDTTRPAHAAPVPPEFSAAYDGIEGLDGPDGCCSAWRLTLADDGSHRWTSTDGKADLAYDAATGIHIHRMSAGAGASEGRPNYIVTSGVPAGGPDRRIARPDPLDPIADFVVALARAGDPRITQSTVAGRPAWHYDGPTAVDRLGGDGAPNHAVADVDQTSGVLLQLTTRVDELVVNRFTASDVAISDKVDRSRYSIELPVGAQKTDVRLGFAARTFEEAAADLPYDLLLPDDARVPTGFRLESLAVNREVPSPTGPEGMNPPAKNVAALTWHNGASRFTITLRPSGGEQWDDPFGGEGVVLDSSPVRLELPGRPPLEGTVAVDAPARPHLWGITGDVVVTVSGDLSRAELERVAGSLRPYRAG